MTKLKFWAVGLNFDYGVLQLPEGEEPDSMEWPSIDGPFSTLGAAKKRALEWIAGDRNHLQVQASEIRAMRRIVKKAQKNANQRKAD